MKILSSIPLWLRNKYFLTGSVFLVWLLFFDDRDMMSNITHNRELKQLEQSRDYYQKQIEATQKELDLLKNDPAVLEKYAREKYMMKRDNEDLFIIK
jgi:cell division protein DivIC